MVRNRPLAAAVAAALTIVGTLAITSNESMTKSILRDQVLHGGSGFFFQAKRSLLTYSWTFRPIEGSYGGDIWRSQLIANLLWVVFMFLVVYVAARGRTGLGQVLLASFTGGVVAAVFAKIIGSWGLPRYYRLNTDLDAATNAVFGVPNGSVIFYASCASLLAAVVATVVTMVSRTYEPDPVPLQSDEQDRYRPVDGPAWEPSDTGTSEVSATSEVPTEGPRPPADR